MTLKYHQIGQVIFEYYLVAVRIGAEILCCSWSSVGSAECAKNICSDTNRLYSVGGSSRVGWLAGVGARYLAEPSGADPSRADPSGGRPQQRRPEQGAAREELQAEPSGSRRMGPRRDAYLPQNNIKSSTCKNLHSVMFLELIAPMWCIGRRYT